MLVQKEKAKKRDFGDTITPKDVFSILGGLTGAIFQSADIMMVNTPEGFSDFYVEPVIFDGEQKRTSRYEQDIVYFLRDCLIILNGNTAPGKNTAMYTNPNDWLFQLFVHQPQDDVRYAATLVKVAPFLATNGYWLKQYEGGAMIVKRQDSTAGEVDAA